MKCEELNNTNSRSLNSHCLGQIIEPQVVVEISSLNESRLSLASNAIATKTLQ